VRGLAGVDLKLRDDLFEFAIGRHAHQFHLGLALGLRVRNEAVKQRLAHLKEWAEDEWVHGSSK